MDESSIACDVCCEINLSIQDIWAHIKLHQVWHSLHLNYHDAY